MSPQQVTPPSYVHCYESQLMFCSCKANTFLLLHACFQDKQPFQTDSFHTKERLAYCPKMPKGNCIQAQKSTKNIWQSFSNALLSLFFCYHAKAFKLFCQIQLRFIRMRVKRPTYIFFIDFRIYILHSIAL